MKISLFSIISLLSLSLMNCLHYINLTNLTDVVLEDTPPIIDPELQKDLQEMDRVKEKSKQVVCMIIVRNSLAKGNEILTNSLKNTKFDKAHVFDKVLTLMVDKCQRQVSESIIEEVLNPDNVLNFNENQLKLIDIDTNLLNDEPKFSENELQILKEIHDDVSSDEEKVSVDIDSEKGSSKLILQCFILAIAVILLYLLYKAKCAKKNLTEKTKKKNR